jgi:hypothetical protein
MVDVAVGAEVEVADGGKPVFVGLATVLVDPTKGVGEGGII